MSSTNETVQAAPPPTPSAMRNDRGGKAASGAPVVWKRLLLGGLMAAAAATPPSNAGADDCQDAVRQLDLDACAARELQKTDGDLDRAYDALQARLNDDAAARGLLNEAQRAWRVFRDAECAFSTFENAGGSAHSMLVAYCRAALTKARLDDLRAHLAPDAGMAGGARCGGEADPPC